MTIKARRVFRLPLVGEVGFTRTVKPGEKIGGQQGPGVRREAVVVDDETVTVSNDVIFPFPYGLHGVFGIRLLKSNEINKSEESRGIRTRLGRVNISWEATLPPQARK